MPTAARNSPLMPKTVSSVVEKRYSTIDAATTLSMAANSGAIKVASILCNSQRTAAANGNGSPVVRNTRLDRSQAYCE